MTWSKKLYCGLERQTRYYNKLQLRKAPKNYNKAKIVKGRGKNNTCPTLFEGQVKTDTGVMIAEVIWRAPPSRHSCRQPHSGLDRDRYVQHVGGERLSTPT